MRVTAVTRQYCHIGTRTIAYLDSAPGNATLRTYVLLHAFPIGANLWEPQMRNIPEGWRLITPDLRGFGGSTEVEPVSATSMSDYADDLVDLLDELGGGGGFAPGGRGIDVEQPGVGMGMELRIDGISEPALLAHLLEQARRHSAADDVGEHSRGVEVGIERVHIHRHHARRMSAIHDGDYAA